MIPFQETPVPHGTCIRVPTLLICGDHDESDPSLSRYMHDKIAGSTLVVVPQAGHMAFVDQPGMYLKSVDEFLHGDVKASSGPHR